MSRRKSLAPPVKVDYEVVSADLTTKQRIVLASYQKLLQLLIDLNAQVVEISKTPTATLAHLRDLELRFSIVHNSLKASIFSVDAGKKT